MDSEKRLTGYNPQLHEAFLLAWFFHLRQTGDINTTFFKDLHNITPFLNYFANGVKLGFAYDVKGLTFAVWYHPILDAAEFGLWIREDKRQSPSSLKCLYEAFDHVFDLFPVIMSVCKQGHLREIHEKIGFNVSADIPAAWDGNTIQIYYLTKEAYNERRRRNGINGRGSDHRRSAAEEVERIE